MTAILLSPAVVQADSLSVSALITVTATVAPARGIVVNGQQQMVEIYSNTNQNVTPTVYLNSDPGPVLPLTPVLQQQYQQIINQTKHTIGVVIPVPATANQTAAVSLPNQLLRLVSSALKPTFLLKFD